jgi:endonuclease/exonuclease/phosphatase family metal-dependent hydrolase
MSKKNTAESFGDRTLADGESADTSRSVRSRRSVLGRVGTALVGTGLLASTPGISRAASSGDDGGREDLRFLFANTYLFDGVLGFVNEAPARSARAAEFGRIIDEEYDVAALCEVFEDDDRETLLESIDADVRSETGPEGYFTQITSGLQTVSKLPVTATGQHWYDAGSPYVAKGVLYTRIEVGPGAIDLFSTHTYVDVGVDDGLVGPDVAYYRRQQLEELVEFVEETKAEHDPEGRVPTIVTGDFNVQARSEEHENVAWMADRLNLYDAWSRHRNGSGPTWMAREGEEYDGGNMYPICRFDTGGEAPFYCTETDSAQGMRLDYVFVENEAESHVISLDVESIRRRPWWRNPDVGPGESATDYWRSDEEETPNYLSDHMGLEVDFAVAER